MCRKARIKELRGCVLDTQDYQSQAGNSRRGRTDDQIAPLLGKKDDEATRAYESKVV